MGRGRSRGRWPRGVGVRVESADWLDATAEGPVLSAGADTYAPTGEPEFDASGIGAGLAVGVGESAWDAAPAPSYETTWNTGSKTGFASRF